MIFKDVLCGVVLLRRFDRNVSTVKAWVSLLEVTTDDFTFLPLTVPGSESGNDPSLLPWTKFNLPALVVSHWE